MFGRLRMLFLRGKHVSEMIMDVGITGLQRHHVPVTGFRLLELIQLLADRAEQIPSLGVSPIRLAHLFEQLPGLGEPMLLEQCADLPLFSAREWVLA
jgi:hypothetical protein